MIIEADQGVRLTLQPNLEMNSFFKLSSFKHEAVVQSCNRHEELRIVQIGFLH